MATTTQSGKSRATDQEICFATIEKALAAQSANPEFSTLGVWLPVGLIANGKVNRNILTVEGLDFGWCEEVKNNQTMIRQFKFVTEYHVLYDRNIYFELELFPWDRMPFKTREAGITHVLRNFMGNVVIRQTVVSEKAIPSMLNKLLGYGADFLIQHCKIPQTIKLHK